MTPMKKYFEIARANDNTNSGICMTLPVIRPIDKGGVLRIPPHTAALVTLFDCVGKVVWAIKTPLKRKLRRRGYHV